MANNDTLTKYEPKILTSIAELDFDTAPLQGVDLNEDVWGYGAPPPADVYKFKWFMDKDGIQILREKADDPKTAFIRIKMIGKLVENEEWNDTPVYTNLDSRVFRGKSISTMIGFIVAAGGKKHLEGNVQLTGKFVAGLVEKILKMEPVVKAEIDWKGSYKWVPEKGRDVGSEKWENKFNHYNEFPDNKDKPGEKLHITTVTGVDKQPHEIRAMLQVVRFFHKDEVVQKKTAGVAVKPLVAATVNEVELEPLPVIVAQSKVQAAPVVVAVAPVAPVVVETVMVGGDDTADLLLD